MFFPSVVIGNSLYFGSIEEIGGLSGRIFGEIIRDVFPNGLFDVAEISVGGYALVGFKTLLLLLKSF